MSFILDALKKSETDRQRQSSPALFEVKVAQPRRGFPSWAIGLAALLGLNALILVWVLMRNPAAAPSAPVAAAPAATPATAVASNDGMITLRIPADAASTVNISPNNHEPGVVAPSAAPPLAEEPMLSGEQQSVPPDYDARDYRPAVPPQQAGAANAASGVLSRDEALAKGAQIPDLRLDLHVYANNPADRFVFINMRKLREGESLPDGTRVVSITPRGAELSYRGTRFTLEGN